MLKKLVLSLSILAIVGIAHAAQPIGKLSDGELMTTVQWWMSVDAEGNITKLAPKGEAFDGFREKLEVAMKDQARDLRDCCIEGQLRWQRLAHNGNAGKGLPIQAHALRLRREKGHSQLEVCT